MLPRTFFNLRNLLLLRLQLIGRLLPAEDCFLPANASLMLLQLSLNDAHALKLPLHLICANARAHFQLCYEVEKDRLLRLMRRIELVERVPRVADIDGQGADSGYEQQWHS